MLVLSQLLILNYNYPKHLCVNESIDGELINNNTTMFWIYKNEKYKVKMESGDILYDLKIKYV